MRHLIRLIVDVIYYHQALQNGILYFFLLLLELTSPFLLALVD
jgi:hypothetical protein